MRWQKSSSITITLVVSKKNMNIPRVIHFVYGIWSTKPMPAYFAETIKLWQDRAWTTKLWNKQQCEELIQKYPQYSEIYHNLPRNIQRADFIRYLIVYFEGGVYCDLDARPGPITLSDQKDCIYFVEHISNDQWCEETIKRYPIREGVPELKIRISNYFFGAIAGHESLLKIIELLIARVKKFPNEIDDYSVLFLTGPDVVTQIAQNYRIEHNTKLYVSHLCTGTWRACNDV
jgi:mannosyltransferase OCH1-like enzyme